MAVRDELDIPLPAMAPSYRPSARRNEQMDPATKRLAIFACVIGTALLGLVGVWAFTGHHRSGVPVIEADSRPVKVKPANPGGLQVPGANDEILSGETGGKETVAPGPEAPAPQALKAQEQAAMQAATPPPATQPDAGTPTAAAGTIAQAGPEPHPLPALRPPAAVRLIPGAKPTGPVAAAEPAPRRAARASVPLTPPAPTGTGRPAPSRMPETHGRPLTAAVTGTAAVAGIGAGKPFRTAQADPTPPADAPIQATPLSPLTPGPATTPAAHPAPAEAAAPAAHGHRALVQLAAVGSGEAALKEWGRLAKKYPDLFDGRTPNISKTERDGKVYWRVRTGGFNDLTQATVFCQRAKTQGLACTVTPS